MATSSSAASSSQSSSQLEDASREHIENDDDNNDVDLEAAANVPVETLVEHLLVAKRSLSSMTLVLQANEIATNARKHYEETAMLGAQSAFLRKGIDVEIKLLLRLRRGLAKTYGVGREDFKQIIKTLDAADEKLRKTMDMLRQTMVDPVLRPKGEKPRSLLDFVDEQSVETMVEDLKANVAELQAAQSSFDGDIVRLENDLRKLKDTLSAPATESKPTSSASLADIVATLTSQSTSMAEHLTGLTRHFDMCIKAIRITEGGAALAKRKAAESNPPTQQAETSLDLPSASHGGGDPVSISGVIAEQESHSTTPLSSLSRTERLEIINVVITDAPEVPVVLADLQASLTQMQTDYTHLQTLTSTTKAAYTSVAQALHLLEEISSRLPSYASSKTEFLSRISAEKHSISEKLSEMDSLREFYEGYAGAYDSLILEAERRKNVEAKIEAIWKKARDGVNKLVEGDTRDRDAFRSEVGEYIPGDLWTEMSGPLRRWRMEVEHDVDEREAVEEQETQRAA